MRTSKFFRVFDFCFPKPNNSIFSKALALFAHFSPNAAILFANQIHLSFRIYKTNGERELNK